VRSTRADILLNLGLSLAGTLASMWLLYAASKALLPTVFGAYLLVRRFVDTLSNAMHLGAPLAIRRYLAVLTSPSDQLGHYVAAVVLSSCGSIVIALALLVAPEEFGRLLIGQQLNSAQLLLWAVLLSGAMPVHYLATSALFARRHTILANCLDILNLSMVPIATSYMIPEVTIANLLGVQATVMLFSGIVVVVLIGLQVAAKSDPGRPIISAAELWETCTYGVPRAASLFLETVFLLIGPWLMRGDLAAVGYVAVAFFVLRLGRTVVQPITLIAGLALGRMHGRGADAEVREGIDLLIGSALFGSIVLTSIVYPWSIDLLRLWLGHDLASHAQPYVAILLFALIPLAVFQVLKEPIEIIWRAPFSLIMFITGICALVLAQVALAGTLGVVRSTCWAYVVSYIVMCVGALLVVRHHVSPANRFGLLRLAAIGFVAWTSNQLAADAVRSSSIIIRGVTFLLAGGFSSVAAGAAYFLLAPPVLASQLKRYALGQRTP
jgi:hypothetical protein